MAATYTPITLEEIDQFLKRAFRTMRPKLVNYKGEAAYELSLSDIVKIRVATSVGFGGASAAGKGEDAIRVGLFSTKTDRWLRMGKQPIVKRTQGWRDSLRERIEDAMEEYYDQWEDKDPSRAV
jgi:hypothetical protein